MFPVANIRRFITRAIRQPFYAMKVFGKRSKSYASYQFRDGASAAPEAITLFLTHKCNLRCKMCGQWGDVGTTKLKPLEEVKEEVPIEIMKNFVDEVARFKPNFTFFGGEPLIYKHCVELIKYIRSKGMHVLMISNAAFLKQHLPQLVDSGLDELNLSLDGGEELHDHIRGLPGLYRKMVDGLQEVNRVKKERGVKKPIINLNCTINRDNYMVLDQLIDAAYEVGANSLTFHHLIFINQKVLDDQKPIDLLLNNSSKDWEGFLFESGMEVEKLIGEIDRIKSKKYPFTVDFYPNLSKEGMRDYYLKPGDVPSGYANRCVSPWISTYLFPNGDIRPCLNSSYSFGNINQDNFHSIWNSKDAVEFRKLLKEKGVFPSCAKCTELFRY